MDRACFETRPDRRHEVHGVAAAEAAMHALALPQHRIGDLDRAVDRFVAAGRVGAEIEHVRGIGLNRMALECDLRHRHRAWKLADLFVLERPAYTILIIT